MKKKQPVPGKPHIYRVYGREAGWRWVWIGEFSNGWPCIDWTKARNPPWPERVP